ncbi:MAG: pseudouridylate synthase [Bacteroidales bacterium]|nr:pseudouridylate synthase [Bacteroidales bacterium]
MNFADLDVKTLIPQKPPFIMIDRLVHFDEVVTRTEFEIVPANIFVEGGKLLEAGLVENIAQTCAARLGYINAIILKDAVRVGFIGAVKSLVIHKLPDVHSTLETTIEVVNEVFNITLVNATTRCNGDVLVTCEMKISVV